MDAKTTTYIVEHGPCTCPERQGGALFVECFHRPPSKITHRLANGVVRILNKAGHMRLLRPDQQVEVEGDLVGVDEAATT